MVHEKTSALAQFGTLRLEKLIWQWCFVVVRIKGGYL